MLNSLLKFTSGLHRTVKKEDVVKTLGFLYSNIENDIIPALNQLGDSKDVDVIKKSNILKTINHNAGLKARDNNDVFNKINNIFKSFLHNRNKLDKIVDKELSEFVTTTAITAKNAAILKVIDDIGGLVFYTLDIHYYVLVDGKVTDFPKIKMKQVAELLPNYISLLKTYNNEYEKILSKLSGVANVSIDVDSDKFGMVESLLAKKGAFFALPINGFINNPIYHLRIWLVDKEIEKYEALKERRELISLRLTELKMKQKGEHNKQLREQIEYYEKVLSDIDYDIKKIEEDD